MTFSPFHKSTFNQQMGLKIRELTTPKETIITSVGVTEVPGVVYYADRHFIFKVNTHEQFLQVFEGSKDRHSQHFLAAESAVLPATLLNYLESYRAVKIGPYVLYDLQR